MTTKSEYIDEDGNVHIEAINPTDRLVMMQGGAILHMTTLIDIDGDETDDLSEAIGAVVQLPCGKWFNVLFADYVRDRVLH